MLLLSHFEEDKDMRSIDVTISGVRLTVVESPTEVTIHLNKGSSVSDPLTAEDIGQLLFMAIKEDALKEMRTYTADFSHTSEEL